MLLKYDRYIATQQALYFALAKVVRSFPFHVRSAGTAFFYNPKKKKLKIFMDVIPLHIGI